MDSLEDANNYCYGYEQKTIEKPNEPFQLHWEACCWVYFTTDDGDLVWGDNIKLTAKVYDLENNSPVFKLPPIWRIMSGCALQAVSLIPFDPDGDTVKCRWANSAESGWIFPFA